MSQIAPIDAVMPSPVQLKGPPKYLSFIGHFWIAASIRNFTVLKAADFMDGPDGKFKTAQQIVSAAGGSWDAKLLYRLLMHVSQAGVVSVDDQTAAPEKAGFRLTDDGLLLRSDNPFSSIVNWELNPLIEDAHFEAVKQIKREGPYANPETFPIQVLVKQTDIFGFMQKPENKEMWTGFNNAMSTFSSLEIEGLNAQSEFNQILKDAQILCDIGASFGALPIAFLKNHTHLQGVLFDLPNVSEGSKQQNANLPPQLAQRVHYKGGSFFEPNTLAAIAPANLVKELNVSNGGKPIEIVYTMKHILHDWSDEKSIEIMKNIQDAFVPTLKNSSVPIRVRLCIVEHHINPRSNFNWVAWGMDNHMMCCTNGMQRNEQMFQHLFKQAGGAFNVDRLLETHGPVSVMVCNLNP